MVEGRGYFLILKGGLDWEKRRKILGLKLILMLLNYEYMNFFVIDLFYYWLILCFLVFGLIMEGRILS